MNLLTVLLALSPVIVIFLLLTLRRTAADVAGLIGWIVVVGVAGMVWIVGRWKLVWEGLVPILIAGLTAGFIAIGMNGLGLVTTTGIAAGLGVVLAMVIYLKVTGRTIIDRSTAPRSIYFLTRFLKLGSYG